jgi:hypothetical protein
MQYHFYVRTCRLFEYSQQTCHSSQKGNTFYERRSQDHVRTNVVRSFRLAGNGFYGSFTDQTDTDTGTDCGEACTNGAKSGLRIQQSDHQRHVLGFYNEKKN